MLAASAARVFNAPPRPRHSRSPRPCRPRPRRAPRRPRGLPPPLPPRPPRAFERGSPPPRPRRGLGLELGLDLFLDHRRRTASGGAATRVRRVFSSASGSKGAAAFRTDDRIMLQIVVARAAIRADALGSPFRLGHGASPFAQSPAARHRALCHERQAAVKSKIIGRPALPTVARRPRCARDGAQCPAPSATPLVLAAPRARSAGAAACPATSRSRIAR